MSITTYAELKTAVANWLGRDALTNRIPEFIAMAEDRIYETLRVRAMEASATINTTAAQRADDLPSGYLQSRSLYVSGDPVQRLEYRTPVNYWSIYASATTGKPVVFTIEGESFEWGPIPDDTYSIVVAHYARPSAMSADSDSPTLLTKARGLFLYGALLEAAPMLGDDPRVALWAQFWDDIMDRIQTADARDRASGDALVMSSDVHVA